MGLFSTAEVAAMSGGLRPPVPKDYRLPDKFPSLSRAYRISLDLESKDNSIAADRGPGWRRDAFIVGFALAIENEKGKLEFSEYYPLRHKGAPNLDEHKVYEWLGDEIAFFSGEIVGANLLYDADGFQYKKIHAPLAKWRDVQWAEALIDENAFSYKLNTLCQKYLKEGKATDELKVLYGPGYIERFDEVHPGHARTYGLGDVQLPLRLFRAQEKELKSQNLVNLFDLESRLMPMLLYMRQRGQRIDMKAAEELHFKFDEKRAEALREATKLIGKRGFELTPENFGKPAVLEMALNHLGIVVPRSETGKPSVTDKWLAALDHPAGKRIAAANKYDKAKETFVEGYVSDYQINGRVHCEFHPLRKVDDESGKNNGTVSGRFSSVHPNLQNIPARDEEIGPLCRAMFIPEEGYDYFSGDYSQIEYRLIVHGACMRAALEKPDKRWGKKAEELFKGLQAAYKARDAYINKPDTDFHTMTAELTGLPRKRAKNINFGIAFCMGVDSLAQALGLVDEKGKPTEEAHKVMNQYHTTVPFVKAVQQAFTEEALSDGFVATLLGRRTHFEMWEPRFQDKSAGRAKALPYAQAVAEYGDKLKRSMTHKALNCFTQGGGADLMKTSMVKAWESGLLDGPELIVSLTVHDELDGSVSPCRIGQEKLRELQHIMETAIPLTLPTPAEFKTGRNWAETH